MDWNEWLLMTEPFGFIIKKLIITFKNILYWFNLRIWLKPTCKEVVHVHENKLYYYNQAQLLLLPDFYALEGMQQELNTCKQ